MVTKEDIIEHVTRMAAMIGIDTIIVQDDGFATYIWPKGKEK